MAGPCSPGCVQAQKYVTPDHSSTLARATAAQMKFTVQVLLTHQGSSAVELAVSNTLGLFQSVSWLL
jgi:hypothetical protein